MKQLAPAQFHSIFQCRDNLLESFPTSAAPHPAATAPLAEAHPVPHAREHHMALYPGEDFPRVVLKDQPEHIGQRTAVSGVPSEIEAARSQPAMLLRRRLSSQPPALAKDPENVGACEEIRGGKSLRMFGRKHQGRL